MAKLRIVQIDVITPTGGRFAITPQTPEGSLVVDRIHASAGIVEVRDTGLPRHEAAQEGQSSARVVATYPLTWGLEYSWAVDEA